MLLFQRKKECQPNVTKEEGAWGEKEDPWANNRFPDFLHRVGSRSAATDLLLIFATISIKSSILTGFLFLS